MPTLRPTDFKPPVPTEEQGKQKIPKKEKRKKLPKEGKEGARDAKLPPILEAISGVSSEDDYNALAQLLSVGDNESDIDARSEVNELQMIHMARARVVAAHFSIPKLNDLVRHILTLSLSKGRKSRKEFVAAFQAANMTDNEATAGIIANMTQKLKG